MGSSDASRAQAAPGGARAWGRGAAALALALAVAHFASFFDPERSILGDIKYFLYFAWRIREGAVPHLDLFDNKTFLASFAGALFYRLGEALRVDPLAAIRVGYLGLCGVGGLLAFEVFRRLERRDALAGLLGLLAYLGFGFIGALAAVGNVPKLLMALGGSACALLVFGRRWFAAGVVSALAFMDWQIGALVGLAALAAALLDGRPRGRALARVVAGGCAGLVPFALFYAAHGALGATWRQTVLASFFRASASFAGLSGPPPLERIARQVPLSCHGHEWLFACGLLGLAVLPVRLWLSWRADERRLLVPLAVYHVGVVAFSAVNFQRYGDFFLLLHSVAFFLGLVWLELYRLARSRIAPPGAPRARRVAFAGALLALALAASRPGPLRPEVVLFTPYVPADVTLSDQKRVAQEVDERTRSLRFAALGWTELLFLMRRENPFPLVYWNYAAYGYHADVNQESFADAAARVLLSADPEAFIWTPKVALPRALQRDFETTWIGGESSGGYRVPLAVRRAR